MTPEEEEFQRLIQDQEARAAMEHEVRRMEAREDAALERKTFRLDPDQLLCLMASMMLSGVFTFKHPSQSFYPAMKLAWTVYERLVIDQEYTEGWVCEEIYNTGPEGAD